MKRVCASLMAIAAAAVIAGCNFLPGRPSASDLPLRPTQVVDFARLYGDNCAGCHGRDGKDGAALALNNPVYLALIDDQSLRRTIAQGVRRTTMPAFALSAGGVLTDDQIQIVMSGMRERWQRGLTIIAGAPPLASGGQGDAIRGAQVYAAACESCHGAEGRGGPKAGSIADGSFLALVSDQYLRTLTIAGRPDLGHPDWRGYISGQPLSGQQVSDVVAWLAAKRERLAASDAEDLEQ